MFHVPVFLAFLALCHSHAVVPFVPAVHSAPLVVPYPVHHGYTGHELLGHEVYKPLHQVWKRSPHYVEPLTHVAPLAVSHQSRVDYHQPLVKTVVVPVVKPVLVPVVKPVVPLHDPFLHKHPVHHHGAHYPHHTHYGY